MYHEKTSICQTDKLSFYSFNNENISLRFVNNTAGYRRLKIWKRVYKKNEDESRGRANLYTWKWNQAVRDTIIDDDDMSLWHRVTLLRKTGAPHPDVTRKTWHLTLEAYVNFIFVQSYWSPLAPGDIPASFHLRAKIEFFNSVLEKKESKAPANG